jgi:predicted Holliday junction resolvase-like endonuclease
MSLKFILICIIVLWLLNKIYKVVFPILHITSSATNRMREMQEQMKKMEQNMAEQEARQTQKKRSKVDGDYIDYEELK